MGQLRLYDHGQLHKVAEIVRHPKFNVSLSAWGGADIALLRLEAPVMLSQHVNPVSLAPESLVLSPGTKCWVTGWGTFGAHGKTGGGGQRRDKAEDTGVGWGPHGPRPRSVGEHARHRWAGRTTGHPPPARPQEASENVLV